MKKRKAAQEKYRKGLVKMDSDRFKQSADELQAKRDALLQEVLELKNKVNLGTATPQEGEKLRHCMTEVVLCEKLIGHFGKFDGEARSLKGAGS